MNRSAHPTPETLAAFVDGRLAGEERRALVAHLDACPDCYEVFAETVRFQGEEEPRGHVLRSPRLAAKRWPRWAAAAAAVVAVAIAVAVLRMEPERPLLPSEAVVAAIEVPEGVGVAGAVWRGWLEADDAFASAGLTEEAVAFRAGVWLVDLRAAIHAGETGSAEVALAKLSETFEPAGLQEELEKPLERARRAADRGRSGSLEKAATEIEAGAEELLDPFHLAFGKWAEAGRLAAAVGDGEFFRSPEYGEFRAKIEERALPELVVEALGEIDTLTREELSPPEAMEELERSFELLIGRSGGMP